MRSAIMAAALLFATPATAVYAQDYSTTAPIPAFQAAPYVSMVADLHAYYIGSEQAGGTLAQRINRRNALIRSIFAKIEPERRPLYAAHRVRQERHIRCKKSGSGGTKRCPDEMVWGEGYEVIPESMGDTGRHFKEGPAIVGGNRIVAVLGRAGAGTNTGDYWGTARLSAAEVERRVTADLESVRATLRARNLPTDEAIDLEVE